MKLDNNLLDLCFGLTDMYEAYFKDKLRDNFISEKDIEEIVNNFDFRKEIIFSLNKEYKKGAKFSEFCKAENIDERIVNLLKFDGSLYLHQEKAIKSIRSGTCTVVSTGTGSGKTESFLIPILDYCLKTASKGIKAIIIYPMNALAGDQMRRIAEAVEGTDITFGIFTGATPDNPNDKNSGVVLSENQIIYRKDIIEKQPDILITNYVMLDYILTDPKKRKMIEASKEVLKYSVLDEIHTYRGNKGTHIKYLLHRLKSYLKDDIVQIGCSATLSRSKEGEKQEGYLAGSEIDTYVKKMFDVESYNYIEPVYEKELDSSRPLQDKEYMELENHYITKKVKDFLSHGSKTLKEILDKLNGEENTITIDEFRKFLIKIVDMNNKYPEYPVLDFRIHIFFLEISNILKRCINCGRYHTSVLSNCSDCGHPVFPVYKKDYTKCIGKVKGNLLTNEVLPSSDDNSSTFYVLINNKKLGLEQRPFDGDKLQFKGHYQIVDDCIRLEYEEDGLLELCYLNIEDYEKGLIKLEETQKKEFLHNVFKQSLQKLSEKERKILAFIDNRESAGRYSAIFNDEFLSNFFMESVRFVNSQCKNLNIKEVYALVVEEIEKLREKNYDSELINILLKEFKLWFIRSIAIPENSGLEKTPKLVLLDKELIKDKVEKEFVDILLKERILDREALKEKGKYIRFHLGYSQYKKGAVISKVKRDGSSKYSYLSFASDGQKYRDFANKYPNRMGSLVALLSNKEVLVSEKLDSNNYIYFLNISKIGFNKENTTYSSIEEIFLKEVFWAGAHSSEVSEDTKHKHEEDFQNAKLNLLISTPTLEMGIDIGKLNMVYMIGVPPMPSNYAQRAGRAGRKGNRFALLLTMCSESNHHDMYYFNNPKEMIEGVITPPSFDDRNTKILKKHINALLIPDIKGLGSKVDINRFMVCCRKVYGDLYDYEKLIPKSVEMWRRFEVDRLSQHKLYDLGLYPDYSFRRDEIKAIDIKYEKALKENPDLDDKDFILSTREPEIAYKEFLPESSMFIGENYYRFTSEGNYKTFETEDYGAIRQYDSIYCTDKVQNIYKNRERIKYITVIKIRPKKSMIHKDLNKDENITAYFEKSLPIFFINRGRKSKDEIKKFNDEKGEFSIGYNVKRDSILFELSNKVVSLKHVVSLFSALDRTMKDELGLDEAELGWLIDESLEFENKKEDKSYVVLYDKTGCGNIDMNKIFKDLKSLIDLAYKKLKKCNCTTTSGCYLCMKGYNIQKHSPFMSKNDAIMFTGYLMNYNKFKPEITIEDEGFYSELDLYIKLNSANKNIVITSDEGELCNEKYSQDNSDIFKVLSHILKDKVDNDDYESVAIHCKQDYIVKAINEEGNLKKGLEEFKLFKFYSLRFKSVKGVKI